MRHNAEVKSHPPPPVHPLPCHIIVTLLHALTQIVGNLHWQSWKRNRNVCESWPASCIGRRKRAEEVNRKGNCPVVSLPHLLIHVDRGPCCKTTNDLYIQQWHSDHYITTSQIIVAITTVKQEAVSQPLLPPAPDRITYIG